MRAQPLQRRVLDRFASQEGLGQSVGAIVVVRPRLEQHGVAGMDADWPFAEPPGLLVGVSDRVLDGRRPILHVVHAGASYETPWWFSDRRWGDRRYGRAPLHQVVARDPTVGDLAGLPVGWTAWRLTPRRRWHRTWYPGSKAQGVARLCAVMLMLTVGLPLTLALWIVHYGRIERRSRRVRAAMDQVLRHGVPPHATLRDTLAFLRFPAIAAFARAQRLADVHIDTEFRKGSAYLEGVIGSQAYPEGKMLLLRMAPGDRWPAPQLRVYFFFDRSDHLTHYTVEWFTPK